VSRDPHVNIAITVIFKGANRKRESAERCKLAEPGKGRDTGASRLTEKTDTRAAAFHQRCDFLPAATSAENCVDCPRGTESEVHFPFDFVVRCLAANRIC